MERAFCFGLKTSAPHPIQGTNMRIEDVNTEVLRRELLNRLPLALCNASELAGELQRRGLEPRGGYQLIPSQEHDRSSVERTILRITCEYFGTSQRNVLNPRCQKSDASLARSIVIYFMRLQGLDIEIIMNLFKVSKRDTIYSRAKFIRDRDKKDEVFSRQLHEIRSKIEHEQENDGKQCEGASNGPDSEGSGD
jgi:hypothetical protein